MSNPTKKYDKLMNPEKYTQRDTKGIDKFADFVKSRFEKMAESKSDWNRRVEQIYPLWDVFVEWLVEGEDYSKPVKFPTLRDVAMSIRDDIMQNPPEARLTPKHGESPSKAQALGFAVKEIKDNIYEKRVKKECLADMLFYGEGFRKISYRKNIKILPNGDEKVIWDSVGSERIDPRDIFVDNFGRYLWDPYGGNQKRDIIIRHQYSWSTFKDRFGDMKGVNISGVVPKNLDAIQLGNPSVQFKSDRETQEELPQEIGAKVYEYWNQELGIYAIIANEVTILGPVPIENEHCRIPVVNYKFEERRDSFWGTSLAELIAPHIYARDTIFNLEFKGLKLRLQPVLAVDSNLGFDKNRHKAYPGNVWSFNTPTEQGKTIANSIVPVPLAQGDSNGFYNMDKYIESQLVMSTNQDTRALNISPQELATQTAYKHESNKKRITSIVFSNEIEAEAQLTELMISDIKQFMLGNVDVKINGRKTKRPRKAMVKGFVVDQSEDGIAKFKPQQGAESYFRLTEESADIEVDVNVEDMRSKVLSQEEQIGRILQFVPIASNFITSFAQHEPSLLKKLDAIGILEQMAEAIDMDLSRTVRSSDVENVETIKAENMAFITGQDVPLPPNETQATSKIHLKEHAKLRWIYKNGTSTGKETGIWKGLSQAGKMAWQRHYDATLANSIKYVPPVDETAQPMPPVPMDQAKGGAGNATNQGGGTKMALPDSKLNSKGDQNNVPVNKTLLRN